MVKTGQANGNMKYDQSSTHWDKIIPRINLGGGGECPIIVVGIEPERVDGFDLIIDAFNERQTLW